MEIKNITCMHRFGCVTQVTEFQREDAWRTLRLQLKDRNLLLKIWTSPQTSSPSAVQNFTTAQTPNIVIVSEF
jgi:hypothetical protein